MEEYRMTTIKIILAIDLSGSWQYIAAGFRELLGQFSVDLWNVRVRALGLFRIILKYPCGLLSPKIDPVEIPKSGQERPKSVPRAPMSVPRAFRQYPKQEHPRARQESEVGGQEDPRGVSGSLPRNPRESSEIILAP